jgi:hypothetical protein
MEKETKKKGNWFKDMLFVSETPQETKPVETTVATPQPPVAQPMPVLNSTGTGVIDQNVLDILSKVLDNRNLEGPDYLELGSVMKSLETVIPDENTRLIAAYASVKAQDPKLTKKKVTDSLNYYVDEVEKERKNGLQELSELRSINVTAKEQAVDDARGKIVKLTEEIGELNTFINNTNIEIATNKAECDISERNFNTTVDYVVNKLNNDKLKIETLITE